MTEQTAQDFADIERRHDQPPDEPHPRRYSDGSQLLPDGTILDRQGRFYGIDQPAASQLNRCDQCGGSDVCHDERIHETFVYCRDCGAIL